MLYYFDPMYFIILAPAMLLGAWAQLRVRSTYAEAQRRPAPLSGSAAARHILDSSGVHNVQIEMTQGYLSDHYDPRKKVLRLSPDVYKNRSLAAVGIAAHEAGHAIQDARNYAPLSIRNAVVPVASFGTNAGWLIIFVGFVMGGAASVFGNALIWLGLGLFGVVVFFQLVNRPVEFNASARAKEELLQLGIIDSNDAIVVNRVLSAAGWTYVAATLSAILTMVYFLIRLGFLGGRDD